MFKKILAQNYLVLLFLAVLGFAIYANALPNEMFWDDDDFILKNIYIRDWVYFPKYFSENLVAGAYLVSNYWRPLLLIVFSIEWHLWKDWAPGWHFVSIGVHILCSMVLFFLTNRLFKNRTVAFVTAILFLAHPVHNESVVYVNSLGDAQCVFFVLSALVCFAGAAERPVIWLSRRYYFSLLLYICALLSKETGFVLCGLVPLTSFLLLEKSSNIFERGRQTFLKALPFFIIAAVYLYLRSNVLNFASTFNFYADEQNPFTSSILIRLLTFFKAMVQYTGFLFIPYELRVERELPWAQSLWEADVLAGGCIIGFMLWAFFYFWKKNPLITFGFGWFFIAIAPTSNVLVPINALIYEHFLYLPMIGIALIVASFGVRLAEQKRWEKPLTILLFGVIIVFAGINMRRNTDWRTAIRFYEKLIVHSPSYRVINNLGMEYADKGIHDKAEQTYLRAIRLDPQNPVAYHNIAGTYRDTGRIALAEQTFKKALQLDPKFIFSYRSLAQLYLDQKNYSAARGALEEYLRRTPGEHKQVLHWLIELAKLENNWHAVYQYLTLSQQLFPGDPNIPAALREAEERIRQSGH